MIEPHEYEALRALDAWLAKEYPDRSPFGYTIEQNPDSLWVSVDARPHDSVRAGPSVQLYAVFRHTGAVYRVDVGGAVEDDPIIPGETG